MKRFSVFAVAILYLIISSGVVVNVHYCMGRIAEVAFHEVSNDDCGTCGMENSGCCHNDQQIFKLTDSHKASSVLEIRDQFAFAKAAKHFYTEFNPLFCSTLSGERILERGPPESAVVSKNILYCVFRI